MMKEKIIKIIENRSPELAAEEIMVSFNLKEIGVMCPHEFLHKENSEQSFGICLACGTTVFR